jgi:hypothetical protein
MQDFQTIYDAATMGAVDSSEMMIVAFIALGFSAMAINLWLRARSTPKRALSPKQPPLFTAAGVAIAAIIYLIFALFQDFAWASDDTHHRYEILDGCVHDFHEAFQPDHDLSVDTFKLNRHPFKLSDSGWRLGYHRSHHHGSPIAENVHLRVFASGSRMLRIDVFSAKCVSQAKF